ncbi:hypothetical protein BH23BAC1_BH23BAC1_38360 [soil metagenome]
MESNKVDKVFLDHLKEAESYYAVSAEEAKDRIWESIERNNKNKIVIWPFVTAAAAVVIILLLSSQFYLILNKKNNEIAKLELQVTQFKSLAEFKDRQLHEQEKIADQVTESKIQPPDPDKIKTTQVIANENLKPLKDTVFITKFIELVKIEEVEKRQILISSMNPLEPILTKHIPQPEEEKVSKTEFLFTNVQNEDKEKRIPKNQKGLKFKIGNSGMSASQTKPISINLNL